MLFARRGAQPVAILTTHHHWDHAAGNRALRKLYPSIAVYGGQADHVPGCTHWLSDGEALPVGRLEVQAVHAPCHTRGSLLFKVDGPTPCFFGGERRPSALPSRRRPRESCRCCTAAIERGEEHSDEHEYHQPCAGHGHRAARRACDDKTSPPPSALA
eukprot:6554540-Prymnesium_polylepis.1